MTLTGLAKEQFDKWLKENFYQDYDTFEKTEPNAMQWGVYQLWADSMGYSLEVKQNGGIITRYSCCIWQKYNALDGGGGFRTRPEAWKACIEKLNEIVNKKE